MDRTLWTFERKVGVQFSREGFTFFHRVEGSPRPQLIVRDSARRTIPAALWALPLLATAGIAFALPTARLYRGAVIDIALDAPVAHVAPPKKPSAARLAVARPRPVVAQPKVARDSATPLAAANPVATALAAAMRSGDPTEWIDAQTGESGMIVVGALDTRGCRDVVVMTRRADGGIDNAPQSECLS
jgi:hypothetical protein